MQIREEKGLPEDEPLHFLHVLAQDGVGNTTWVRIPLFVEPSDFDPRMLGWLTRRAGKKHDPLG